MRKICAWHKQNFGFELIMGEIDGQGVEGDTHVLCPECEKIERNKLHDAIKSGYFKKIRAGSKE